MVGEGGGVRRSSADELGCRYLLRQNKIFKGFSPPNGFFKLRQGASISPNVGRSVGLSVEKNRKSKKSKNQNSLITFDYLINFAASLRIG